MRDEKGRRSARKERGSVTGEFIEGAVTYVYVHMIQARGRPVGERR